MGKGIQDRLRAFHEHRSGDSESEALGLKLELEDQLDDYDLLAKLHSLQMYRKALKDYKSLLVQKGGASQYKSQISQLLSHVIDQERTNFNDLHMARTSLFRWGWNKHHPANHPLVVIFVLGGITATEVKEIREILGTQKKFNVS